MRAFEYIKANGIPDETCQNYEGREGVCNDLGICRDCTCGNVSAGEVKFTFYGVVFTIMEQDFLDGHCWARHDYPVYGLDKYEPLERDLESDNERMVQQMKREIYTQGTVTCGIRPSLEFHEYKDGILDDAPAASNLTHYVNIVGWDTTDNPKYES